MQIKIKRTVVLMLVGSLLISCNRAERKAEAEHRKQAQAAHDRHLVIHVEKLASGDSIKSVKNKLTQAFPPKETTVLFPGNVATGYLLLTYEGYAADATMISSADHISVVFLDGTYQAYLPLDAKEAELALFNDVVTKLYRAKKISFYDAETLKRDKWFAARGTEPDSYEKELILYQMWQAQRVDEQKSTETEYRYLMVQKDRELTESRERARTNREEARFRREQLALQEQSVRLQRASLISQQLMNVFRQTYQPTFSIHCNTSTYGSYASTSCY